MFFSSKWTGKDAPRGDVLVEERPALKSTPALEAHPLAAHSHDRLREYQELSETLGFAPPELEVEAFKTFLDHSGITVFNLSEVIKYMDAKAAKESKGGLGWEWRTLRSKDEMNHHSFGQHGTRREPNPFSSSSKEVVTPASDYYSYKKMLSYQHNSGVAHYADPVSVNCNTPYDRAVPIHALRKVAKIEKEFGDGKVKFMVSDYAVSAQILYPDPFLMAVIPNPALEKGIGRFIIDFWDEPGFGLEQQLK